MPEPTTVSTDALAAAATDTVIDDGIVDELLVEEISIDGMCGVY